MTFKIPFVLRILSTFTVLGMAGCSTPPEHSPRDPDIRLESINISLDSDANLNSATGLDLLVIYKGDLMDTVMKMKSQEYFEASQQIQRDFPDMVDVWHWELTPGQLVQDYPIRLKNIEPIGAVIFADYLTPGDHRIRLSDHEKITVRLKKEDFCVLELGCSEDLNKTSINKSDTAKKKNAVDALEAQIRQEKSHEEEKGNAEKMLKQAKSIFDEAKKMTKK